MQPRVLALVAVSLGCLALVAAVPSPVDYSFKQFVKEFHRDYVPGSAEWKLRQSIFESRRDLVNAHNADTTKSWKRTARNRFADMTDEERKQRRGGGVYTGPRLDAQADFSWAGHVSTTELPTDVDWRNAGVVTGVKDQGDCGSCYAHAATECIESAVARNSGQLPVLSQQQAAFCTPNAMDCGGTGGCGGGTIELVFQGVMDKDGIAELWTYPYMSYWGGSFPCTFNNSRGGTPIDAQVTSFVKLPRNNYTAVMNTLAAVGPIGISVDAADWHDYDSGVYDGCGTDTVDLDHNVQMVGYGTDPTTGLDYWLVRNSWSTQFGELGYIRVRRYGEKAPCAEDTQPQNGDGCNNGPKQVLVCGSCGILYDTTYADGVPSPFHF